VSPRRPRPRNRFAGSYQKRPVGGVPFREPVDGGGMSSPDAHALATEIQAEQHHWRISAVRLVRHRTCCVVLVDSRTGEEVEILSREDWRRLT
jgi:hypothetical protein